MTTTGTAEPITHTAELTSLPAESLLVSTQPSYAPTYVLIYDAGDHRLAYYVIGSDCDGFYSPDELLRDYGPLELVHRGQAIPVALRPCASTAELIGLLEGDPWAPTPTA